MSTLGAIHLSAAFLAIATGAVILVAVPKGARRHRQLGWLYLASMLTVNVTALMIYKLFGSFGPFHAFAIVSLFGILGGTWAARRARANRLARNKPARGNAVASHYWIMTWTYTGLIAAFASEGITRHPATRTALGGPGIVFGLAVAGATVLVCVIGGILIKSRASRTIAPFAT